MPHQSTVESGPSAESLGAARAWFVQGVVAESRGDDGLAELNYVLAAGMHADSAWSHAKLADFYQRQRRWADAEVAWRRALDREQIWQAHAGLAGIRGRMDDADAERAHLEQALALGGDADVHARLFDLQRQAGDLSGARETLERWQALDLPQLMAGTSHLGRDRALALLRRARAARSVDAHASAMPDLLGAADAGRGQDVAPLIVQSAELSCLWGTAHRWAVSADLDDAQQRTYVQLVAQRVGDVALLERATLSKPSFPVPVVTDHPLWLAPWMPVSGEVGRSVVLAEAWRRAGYADRAASIANNVVTAIPDHQQARVGLARIALQSGHPEQAKVHVVGNPSPEALAIALELGMVPASDVSDRLSAGHEARFVAALADAEMRGASLSNVRPGDASDVAVNDGFVEVPKSSQWYRANRWMAVVRGGDAALAIARSWTSERPDDAIAWVALARASAPADRRASYDRALHLDPCNASALSDLRADRSADWRSRFVEADPMAAQ